MPEVAEKSMLFACSEHGDEIYGHPGDPHECMACGTLQFLRRLWQEGKVSLEMGSVRQALADWDYREPPVPRCTTCGGAAGDDPASPLRIAHKSPCTDGLA